jgi:hypothetical protein
VGSGCSIGIELIGGSSSFEPWRLAPSCANQTVSQLATLAEVQQTNKRLCRAFLLLHELRWVYRVPRDQAREQLEAWLARGHRDRSSHRS